MNAAPPANPQPPADAPLSGQPNLEPGAGRAAAAFIAALSASLVDLARAHRFDTLAYLFDQAALEAQNIAATPQRADDPGETSAANGSQHSHPQGQPR